MDIKVELWGETGKQYRQLLQLSKDLGSHFYNIMVTQSSMSNVFSELANKSQKKKGEFLCSADTLMEWHNNGEIILEALNYFITSVNTVYRKTKDDALIAIQEYEKAK